MSEPPQSVTRDESCNIFNSSTLRHVSLLVFISLREPFDSHYSSQASLVKYFNTVNMAFDG